MGLGWGARGRARRNWTWTSWSARCASRPTLALPSPVLTVTVVPVTPQLANLIFSGYIKGYIAHEKRVLVLSKAAPFPTARLQRPPSSVF